MAQRTVGGTTRQSYEDIYADAEGLDLKVVPGMSYAEVQELLDAYGDELSGTTYDPRTKDPFRAPRRKPVEPTAPVVRDPFQDEAPAPVRATVPLPDWITDRQSETSGQDPVPESVAD